MKLNLNHLIYLLVISLTFFNCNKDLSDDDNGLLKEEGNNSNISSTSTYKIVTAKEMPDVANSFANFIKETNNQDFFVAPMIYELTSLQEEKSYSALVYLGNFDDNIFYNIAVKRNTDQSLGTPKIIEYRTSMAKNTINTSNFKNTNWKLNNYNAYSLKQKLKSSSSKSNTSSSPCTDGVFIPEGGTGFNVTHASGDNFSDNIFNTDNGGNLGASGTGTRSGVVTVCFATLEVVPYSCNGPNSGTPHPPGPNGGAEGDNSCGDASTGYGGSGEKLSVGEYCTPIFVTVETQTAPITDYLHTITFDFGFYAPCTMQKLRNKLRADLANLDTLGLELLEELVTLLGDESVDHCNDGHGNNEPVIPGFSKSNSQKSTETDCPEPFDINVVIPSNSWDLFEILNTASTPFGDTALTDAQKIWILDYRNIDAVDALLTYINANGNSANTRGFAKEIINFNIEKNWKEELKRAIANGITSTAELTHKIYGKLSSIASTYPSSIGYINTIVDGLREVAEEFIDTNPSTCTWGDLFNMWLFEKGNNPMNISSNSAVTTTTLKVQEGVNQARDKALIKIQNNDLQQNVVNHTWVFGQNEAYDSVSNQIIETAFLGSYNTKVEIIEISPSNHQLKFTIENTSGWASATRFRIDNDNDGQHDGIFPDTIRNDADNNPNNDNDNINLGGNFKQVWTWTENL